MAQDWGRSAPPVSLQRALHPMWFQNQGTVSAAAPPKLTLLFAPVGLLLTDLMALGDQKHAELMQDILEVNAHEDVTPVHELAPLQAATSKGG